MHNVQWRLISGDSPKSSFYQIDFRFAKTLLHCALNIEHCTLYIEKGFLSGSLFDCIDAFAENEEALIQKFRDKVYHHVYRRDEVFVP